MRTTIGAASGIIIGAAALTEAEQRSLSKAAHTFGVDMRVIKASSEFSC